MGALEKSTNSSCKTLHSSESAGLKSDRPTSVDPSPTTLKGAKKRPPYKSGPLAHHTQRGYKATALQEYNTTPTTNTTQQDTFNNTAAPPHNATQRNATQHTNTQYNARQQHNAIKTNANINTNANDTNSNQFMKNTHGDVTLKPRSAATKVRQKNGIPLPPLRLLAPPWRQYRGLTPLLGIYVYSQKRVGNSLRRYLRCFRPTSERKK